MERFITRATAAEWERIYLYLTLKVEKWPGEMGEKAPQEVPAEIVNVIREETKEAVVEVPAEAAEEVVKEVTMAASEEVAEEVVAELAEETVKELAAGVTDEAVKELAAETTEETVKELTAEATEEAVKEVTVEVENKAAEETVKKAPKAPEVRVYLLNKDKFPEAEFEVLERTENEMRLKLNITNTGINRCIVNGTYTVLTVVGKIGFSIAEYEGTTERLATWGRHFLYKSNKGVYSVSFLMDEFSEEPTLLVLVYNAVQKDIANIPKRKDPKKSKKSKKSPPKKLPAYKQTAIWKFGKSVKNWFKALPKKIKSIPKKIKGIPKAVKKRILKYVDSHAESWGKKIYKYSNDRHKKQRKNGAKPVILFFSEQDDKLALNMQILYDRLFERGLDQQYEIITSLRKRSSVKQTRKSEVINLWKLGRADTIIMDDHSPTFDRIKLKESTKVIQIWHAGAGFKGVGYSRWGHMGCPGPYCCHRQYTYCISGSANISGFFSEQFGILDEQIIPTGMPRFDLFCNAEYRAKKTAELYERYPQAVGKQVVLFAPTYRGRDRKTAYYPYERIDFEGLAEYCRARNAVIFFKMHPWVAQPVPIAEEYADIMFNLNDYGNINDLFYITDLLITDYSSCIYEFSLMNKPMMFFAYDKTQYSTSRGFHRNYDDTIPGKLCETFESLLQAMWEEDYEFEKVGQYVQKHFDAVDDHNSDRLIDWLIVGPLPDEYKKALSKKKKRVNDMRNKSFKNLFEKPKAKPAPKPEVVLPETALGVETTAEVTSNAQADISNPEQIAETTGQTEEIVVETAAVTIEESIPTGVN